jgi:uncharacterized protein YegL
VSYNRRLPVYLLIDCSESMVGDSFSAVTHGLATLIGDLRRNPMALETAAISVITFASTAQQVVPLTEIISFQVPKLKMGSGTALGAALRLWLDCMSREVVKTTVEQKGDYKPLCFLLTDGEPTDQWEEIADHVRTNVAGKQANVIMVACGAEADTQKLRRISDTVLVLNEDQPNAFGNFFKWVSASVSMTSQRIEIDPRQPIPAPTLPEGLETAPSERKAPQSDRWVFLHLRCVNNRGFYILRHKKTTEGRGGNAPKYTAVAAHPVNDFEFSPGDEIAQNLKVSTAALIGNQKCPYCQNPNWARCASGHLHCCPKLTASLTLTCPWCNATASYSAASFDVARGVG